MKELPAERTGREREPRSPDASGNHAIQPVYAREPAAASLLRLLAASRTVTKPPQIARVVAAALVDTLGAAGGYVWLRSDPRKGFSFAASQRGQIPSVGRSGVGLSPENAPWLRRLTNQRGAMLLEAEVAVPMVVASSDADLAVAPIWCRDWVSGIAVAVYEGAEPPNRFDLRALTTIAIQAGIALEGNDLRQVLSAKEQTLESLIRTTIEAQEEERRRVAAEIHDGVTQQLIGIWYRVQACERLLDRDVDLAREELAHIKARIDEALVETRVAIYNLRPSTLDDLGLVPTLNTLVNEFTEETGIHADLHVQGDVRLPSHLETGLYRIVQEALTNVKKHAGASEVFISIGIEDRFVRLVVRDNGRGFDVARARQVGKRQTSFGLTGMNERARLVGGTLRVEAGEGRGTVVTVRVPLDGSGA